MKYIAIVDDNFLSNFRRDDNGLTLVLTDKNGVTRAVPLKPVNTYTIVLPDGQSAYITQGHIDALVEYEKQVTIKEALERFNKTFDEISFAENHKVFHDISLFAGCDKCPAHNSCNDAYYSTAPNCNHYNKTEEEFKAWLKANGWVKGDKE